MKDDKCHMNLLFNIKEYDYFHLIFLMIPYIILLDIVILGGQNI